MRRARAAWAACVLAASLVAGCAPHAPRVSVVSVWLPFASERWDSLAARFERANPGVRVAARSFEPGTLRDSVAAALASGALPDLAVLDSTVLPELLSRGVLSDWSAGVADLRDSLVGWESCSVGDALYGMPWLLETRAVWYDRDAFARANLDPGVVLANWQEFAKAAPRLRAVGAPVGFASDDPMGLPMACLFALGAVLGPGERESLVVDSEAARLVLGSLAKVRAVSRVAAHDVLRDEFRAGRLGVFVGGAGDCAAGDRIACAPFPAPDTATAAYGGVAQARVLASFTHSAHKEAALRLARFLAGPAQAPEVERTFPAVTPAASRAGSFAAQVRRAWVPPSAAHGRERARELAGLVETWLAAGALPDTALRGAQVRLDEWRKARP